MAGTGVPYVKEEAAAKEKVKTWKKIKLVLPLLGFLLEISSFVQFRA